MSRAVDGMARPLAHQKICKVVARPRLNPGAAVYIPPQISVTVRGKEIDVNTYSILMEMGAVAGEYLNTYYFPAVNK